MAMKVARIIACCIGFLMVLSSMLMLVSPILSLSTVDYGITLEKATIDFQGIFMLFLLHVILIPCVYLYGTPPGRFDESVKAIHESWDALFRVDFLAWIIVIVIIWASPIIGYYAGDVLRSIAEQELSGAVLWEFWFDAIFKRILVPIVLVSVVWAVLIFFCCFLFSLFFGFIFVMRKRFQGKIQNEG